MKLVRNLTHHMIEILPWMAQKILIILHIFVQQLEESYLDFSVYLSDILLIQYKMTTTDISSNLHQDTLGAILDRVTNPLQVVGRFREFLETDTNPKSDGDTSLEVNTQLSASDFLEFVTVPATHPDPNPAARIGSSRPENIPGFIEDVGPAFQPSATFGADASLNFDDVDTNNIDSSNVDFGVLENLDFSVFNFDDLATMPEWAVTAKAIPEGQ